MGNPARNEGHATQAEWKKQSHAVIADCRFQIADFADSLRFTNSVSSPEGIANKESY
jgi:hypothetical protein